MYIVHVVICVLYWLLLKLYGGCHSFDTLHTYPLAYHQAKYPSFAGEVKSKCMLSECRKTVVAAGNWEHLYCDSVSMAHIDQGITKHSNYTQQSGIALCLMLAQRIYAALKL